MQNAILRKKDVSKRFLEDGGFLKFHRINVGLFSVHLCNLALFSIANSLFIVICLSRADKKFHLLATIVPPPTKSVPKSQHTQTSARWTPSQQKKSTWTLSKCYFVKKLSGIGREVSEGSLEVIKNFDFFDFCYFHAK